MILALTAAATCLHCSPATYYSATWCLLLKAMLSKHLFWLT